MAGLIRIVLPVFCIFVFIQPVAWAKECKDGPCCKHGDIKGPIITHGKKEDDDKSDSGTDMGDMALGSLTVLSGALALGQKLREGSNKMGGTWDKNSEAQSKVLRQMLVSKSVAEEKNRNIRSFGSGSESYNSFDSEMGQSVRKGLKARKKLSSRISEDIYSYSRSFDTKHQVRKRLKDTATGSGILSSNTMSASELTKSVEIAKTILDPDPARNLASRKKTRGGQDYKLVRKAKEAKFQVPNAILSDVIASRAPTIKSEGWITEIYSRTGGSGKPPQTHDGSVSLNGLMEMISNMRFANQDWLADKEGIHGKTKVGVLREKLQSRIDSLMMEYQKMRWLDRMAAIMAQKRLSVSHAPHD